MNKDSSAVESKLGANSTFPRSQITVELRAALGMIDRYGFTADSIPLDFYDYVTVQSGKKNREMFNADSVYFYNLPLDKAYQGKYTYCTGMVISKKGRATMLFKWFFTPKGKKKEDEYIKRLSKQIWYDEPWTY